MTPEQVGYLAAKDVYVQTMARHGADSPQSYPAQRAMFVAELGLLRGYGGTDRERSGVDRDAREEGKAVAPLRAHDSQVSRMTKDQMVAEVRLLAERFGQLSRRYDHEPGTAQERAGIHREMQTLVERDHALRTEWLARPSMKVERTADHPVGMAISL